MTKNSRPRSLRSWQTHFVRLLRLRLIIPLLKGKHLPDYIARGVATGVAVALTPLVGIQIPIVMLCWLIVRKYYKPWDFHPGVAMAWTLLTNVLTLPFFYYAFLLTGRVILGRWERIRDFDTFYNRLSNLLPQNSGWVETIFIYLQRILVEFGWPMFVGSIPWAILGGWIGYRWSLRLVIAFQQRRKQPKTNNG